MMTPHEWVKKNPPGRLMLNDLWECSRCGFSVKVPPGQIPNQETRKFDGREDCDESVILTVQGE